MSIEGLDAWFDSAEHNGLSTYRHTIERDGEDCYSVDAWDLSEFCDFLRKNAPDLIGIKCNIGCGGIWFTSADLEEASWL